MAASPHRRTLLITAGLLGLGGSALAGMGRQLTAVHVRGCAALLPLAQHSAEAYMEEVLGSTVVVGGCDGAVAIKALLDGTADIALSDGPVPAGLRGELARRGLSLDSWTVAYQAMAALVHPANPVNGLTQAQLRDIFGGAIGNWREVGGADAPVTVLLDRPDGSLYQVWQDQVLGNDGTFPAQARLVDAADKLAALQADPLALAYADAATATAPLKRLRIDGVEPGVDQIRSGAYPLRSPLTVLTLAKPPESVREFVRHFREAGKSGRFADVAPAVTVN